MANSWLITDLHSVTCFAPTASQKTDAFLQPLHAKVP
jgi:hypothetical protein